MKKLAKVLSLSLVLVLCFAMFTACSRVTQAYADKVNDAAKNDKHYTYDKVMKDLGDEAVDFTVEILGIRGGAIIAVKGCTNSEQLDKKLNSGEEVEGLVITILNGKATSAAYKKITNADKK